MFSSCSILIVNFHLPCSDERFLLCFVFRKILRRKNVKWIASFYALKTPDFVSTKTAEAMSVRSVSDEGCSAVNSLAIRYLKNCYHQQSTETNFMGQDEQLFPSLYIWNMENTRGCHLYGRAVWFLFCLPLRKCRGVFPFPSVLSTLQF